jgi:hypothetical protein
VPGRPGSQFVALDQHHVIPALASQVIKRGATGDAAAYYNHARLRFYVVVCHLFESGALIAINADPQAFDNRKIIKND